MRLSDGRSDINLYLKESPPQSAQQVENCLRPVMEIHRKVKGEKSSQHNSLFSLSRKIIGRERESEWRL